MSNGGDLMDRERFVEATVEPDDAYATGIYRWWHLSRPSPEIERALEQGWLVPPGRVLDLGCGLGTEAARLRGVGFVSVGIDLSPVAIGRAAVAHPDVHLACADACQLPFRDATFDALIDRGCFHYIPPTGRTVYAGEAGRVLRPGGRLLVRACLHAAGVRNDVDEALLRRIFAGWRCLVMERAVIPSDTRSMEALVALFERGP